MKKNMLEILTPILCVLPATCAAAPAFDVRGGWEYTMTDQNGNVYDAGVITWCK